MVKTVVKTVPPTCRQLHHRVLAQHIQHFQIADPAQDLVQSDPRSRGEGQSPQPALHVRLGQEHPQLLGDARARQFRDQKGRALGQVYPALPRGEDGQEGDHGLRVWGGLCGDRGGVVRAGLDGSQHVRFPQQGHQFCQGGLVQGQCSQLPGRVRRVLHARVGVPGVGDEHIVHPPRHEEQFLGLVQPQHDHRRQRPQGTGLLHNGPHPKGHRDGADKDVQHISRLGVELLRAQSVQVDIPLAQFQPHLLQHPVDLDAQGVQVHRAEDGARVDAQGLTRRGQIEGIRQHGAAQGGQIHRAHAQCREVQGLGQGLRGDLIAGHLAGQSCWFTG